jgi:hypothetical protein
MCFDQCPILVASPVCLLVAEREQVIKELFVFRIVVAQFAKHGLELFAARNGARQRVDHLVACGAAVVVVVVGDSGWSEEEKS